MPPHPAVHLLQSEPQRFARQGAVVATWRTYRGRRLGPYYRLAYREGTRQRSIYLGRQGPLVDQVRNLLGVLQAKHRFRCQARRRRAEFRRKVLRPLKEYLEGAFLLYGNGLYFKGWEVRGIRAYQTRASWARLPGMPQPPAWEPFTGPPPEPITEDMSDPAAPPPQRSSVPQAPFHSNAASEEQRRSGGGVSSRRRCQTRLTTSPERPASTPTSQFPRTTHVHPPLLTPLNLEFRTFVDQNNPQVHMQRRRLPRAPPNMRVAPNRSQCSSPSCHQSFGRRRGSGLPIPASARDRS
jgi:hypothetical protein